MTQALEWVQRHRVDREASTGPLTAETDLLELGVLDSLGFVQLIAFLNERSGRVVDLVDLDVEDLATVTRLCRVYATGERTGAR